MSQLQHLAFQLPTHSTTVLTSGFLNVRNSVTLKCENILGSTFFSSSLADAPLPSETVPFSTGHKRIFILLVGRATHHECGKGKLALRHVTLPCLLTFYFPIFIAVFFIHPRSYTQRIPYWPITYFYNSVHIHFIFIPSSLVFLAIPIVYTHFYNIVLKYTF